MRILAEIIGGRWKIFATPYVKASKLFAAPKSSEFQESLKMSSSLRRSAPKVLHMPRTGSSCRISPRPEGYLDNVHRAASDLYLTGPPFDGLNAIGLSSESRVRATTSAVQDFWCRPP